MVVKFPGLFSQADVDKMLNFFHSSERYTKTSEVPALDGTITSDRIVFNDDNRLQVLSGVIFPKLFGICGNPNLAFEGMICRADHPFAPHTDVTEGPDLDTVSITPPALVFLNVNYTTYRYRKGATSQKIPP